MGHNTVHEVAFLLVNVSLWISDPDSVAGFVLADNDMCLAILQCSL